MIEKIKNIVATGEEKSFFNKGLDWEADTQARIKKSERRAWHVATCAALIALVAVIGIASLAPYKRVVPYVFAVDKATGNVELISAADDRTVAGYQELLDKHWAQRYTIARESYNYHLLQNDYDTCLALSSELVGREYAKQYEGPNARDKKYGSSIELKVHVLSVTLAQDNVGSKAVVRFEKILRRTEADNADPPQYYIATLSYKYAPSMFGKEKDLIQNPLGYSVTSYRVDDEIAPVGPTTPTVK